MSLNAIPFAAPENIHLEALRYKYPMRNSVTLKAEVRQVSECVKRGYPRIALQPLRDDWCSIVGYGPSLADTWREIENPAITVSGAHDYLIERGFVPFWHSECDGRDHKTKHLEKPHHDCVYLMASICCPTVWGQLEGHRVYYWHCANGQHIVKWIGDNDQGSILVAGGSTMGLAAIHLAGILGFRKFRLFGFDGNIHDGKRHAANHYGPPQKVIEQEVGGRTWLTTPQMYNACDEFTWLLEDKSLTFDIRGDSMLKAMVDGRIQ